MVCIVGVRKVTSEIPDVTFIAVHLISSLYYTHFINTGDLSHYRARRPGSRVVANGRATVGDTQRQLATWSVAGSLAVADTLSLVC